MAVGAVSEWRIANSVGLLSRFDCHRWEEMVTHCHLAYRRRGLELVAEGKVISNATNSCALDSADTASGERNASILLRSHPWLSVSGFRPEVQQHLISVPFDGGASVRRSGGLDAQGHGDWQGYGCTTDPDTLVCFP